jgi:hypothetical protein
MGAPRDGHESEIAEAERPQAPAPAQSSAAVTEYTQPVPPGALALAARYRRKHFDRVVSALATGAVLTTPNTLLGIGFRVATAVYGLCWGVSSVKLVKDLLDKGVSRIDDVLLGPNHGSLWLIAGIPKSFARKDRLAQAAFDGDEKKVRKLLAKTDDIDQPGKSGLSASSWARLTGHKAIAVLIDDTVAARGLMPADLEAELAARFAELKELDRKGLLPPLGGENRTAFAAAAQTATPETELSSSPPSVTKKPAP